MPVSWLVGRSVTVGRPVALNPKLGLSAEAVAVGGGLSAPRHFGDLRSQIGNDDSFYEMEQLARAWHHKREPVLYWGQAWPLGIRRQCCITLDPCFWAGFLLLPDYSGASGLDSSCSQIVPGASGLDSSCPQAISGAPGWTPFPDALMFFFRFLLPFIWKKA